MASRAILVVLAVLLVLSCAAPSVPAHSLLRPATQDPGAAAPATPAAFGEASVSALPSRNGPFVTTAAPWTPLALAPGLAAPPPQQFRCPQGDPTSVPDNDDPLDRTVLGCPIRVYDTTNFFGNAQMDVDPSNEANAAFCGLHGYGTDEGPTPRSRSEDSGDPENALGSATHTTFTTANQGLSWSDQPTTPGAGSFGESADCVFDVNGNLYVAYLSNTAAYSPGIYGSNVWLYKAAGTNDPGAVQSAYSDAEQIRGRAAQNPIQRVNLLYVPQYNAPVWVNGTTNSTLQEPADESDVGHFAVVENHTLDRVVVTWFERAGDWRNSSTAYAGWIDAAVTDTSARNHWQGLRFSDPIVDAGGSVKSHPDSQLIGPCMDASNPVYYRGKVYIACVADAGYQARSRARVGDIGIWEIDPMTRNTTLIDTTGLQGGQPRLAASPDGWMVLTTTQRIDENRTDVRVAWGFYGRSWTVQGNLGGTLHSLLENKRTIAAGVTALQLSEDHHSAVMVYMERQNVTQPTIPTIDPQNPPTLPDPDPNSPQSTIPRLTDYRKLVVTFNQCEFPIAASLMELGTSVDPYNADGYSENPNMFQDENDGLAAYRDATGNELLYFAINDYGAMQFGAVIANAPESACIITPPLAGPVAAAVPQALTVPQTATVALGAVAAVASAAIVAYILAVKRKSPQFTAAEAK